MAQGRVKQTFPGNTVRMFNGYRSESSNKLNVQLPSGLSLFFGFLVIVDYNVSGQNADIYYLELATGYEHRFARLTQHTNIVTVSNVTYNSTTGDFEITLGSAKGYIQADIYFVNSTFGDA